MGFLHPVHVKETSTSLLTTKTFTFDEDLIDDLENSTLEGVGSDAETVDRSIESPCMSPILRASNFSNTVLLYCPRASPEHGVSGAELGTA